MRGLKFDKSIKISEFLEELFVNRDDCYAEAYLLKDKNKMGYRKQEGLIDKNLILSHVTQEKTFGVYQLKGSRVIWGCLDFDQNTKEDYENAKKLYLEIKKRGFNPLMEKSGGGEFKVHIWIFGDCEAKDMFYFLENICLEVGIKPHEIFPKQTDISKDGYGNLVKLPLAFHLVTKNTSVLLDDEFNEIGFDDIEKKLKFHLENKDKIPKVIIKEKILSDFNPQKTNPNEFDNFFNQILKTEIPSGITKKDVKIGKKEAGINNNILKNEAIYFFQKGYTLERLEQEVKPIFKKNNWVFEDLKGWFKKAENKEIGLINIGELFEYCKNFYPELSSFLPSRKDEDESFEVYSDEELMNYSPLQESWLIKNQIPKGEIGLLVGKRQDRKTFTALYQGICLANGMNCLEDEITEKKKILFVDLENGKDEIKKRTYLIKKGLGIENKPLDIKYINYPNLKLDRIPSDEYTAKEVGNNFYNFKELLEDFRPDLIIVDCLARIVSFNVDKDNQEISNFFTGVIRPYTKKYGCSWLFIHHLRKPQTNNKPDDLLDEVRGGSELVNYCRFILCCNKPKYQSDSERELIVFSVLKMSNSLKPPAKVISFDMEDGGLKISYEGEPEEILSGEVQCANSIKSWLFEKGIRGEFKTFQIHEATEKGEIKFKKTLVNGGLNALIQQGFLKRIKRGVYIISENKAEPKFKIEEQSQEDFNKILEKSKQSNKKSSQKSNKKINNNQKKL